VQCPLCDCTDVGVSGFGSVIFEGRQYDYKHCRGCGSSFSDPMPDLETLARMYGPSYADAGVGDTDVEDPKEPERVLDWLRRRQPGVFVDFGCGSGSLIVAARALGWTATGVEFHVDVARRVAGETGCSVLNGLDELRRTAPLPADVIHLGDVIEHLTAPLNIVRELAGLLGPSGCLIAQGPLEAGPSLYSSVLRVAGSLRSARTPKGMPPYHVLQATVEGQRILFERAGLAPIEYLLSEVSWPAPARFSATCLGQPRSLALFALRRLSQHASALNPTKWGNRYFYVGTPRRVKA
jgi:SAM-dependent methyltransferase